MPDPTFEERYPEIVHEIQKRRGRWKLTALPFEDVQQMVLVHIWQKYHTFDPARGEFVKWVNKTITNQIWNILRNNHFAWSRPCIQSKGGRKKGTPHGCPFNTGDDTCSKTPSGKQCSECKAYAIWEKRKQSHFAVKQTLPLDNHFNEADSQPGETIGDVNAARAIIDREMKLRLTKLEWRIYRLMYTQDKTPEEIGKALGYRKKKGARMHGGYQVVLAARHRFTELFKQIVEEFGLA